MCMNLIEKVVVKGWRGTCDLCKGSCSRVAVDDHSALSHMYSGSGSRPEVRQGYIFDYSDLYTIVGKTGRKGGI